MVALTPARSVLLLIVASSAFGQSPPGEGIPNMQAIAQGLGVTCEYCHAGQRGAQPLAEGQAPAKMQIARSMIAITRDLNDKVLAATGKPLNQVTRVTCITCHRGVAIPGQLSDIIARTALAQGPEAAIAQYRDLRQQYYGGQSYDFREDTLLTAAEQLIRVKPSIAIPVLRLNLEFYPRSVRSYSQIAYAYTRSLDDESAISTLEKALELEPENGVIKGQLEQLKSYRRRK